MTSETFQQPLLQVAQLSVSFPSPQGLIEAVTPYRLTCMPVKSWLW